MRVAVLGCGPAGLMAAKAARDCGAEVGIFSRKQKSPLYGAQYLHAPIPGVTNGDDHITVDYILQGGIQDYRRKVYGPKWDGTVSPDELESTHEAWDIRETYDRLWAMFESSIQDVEVDPAGVYALTRNPDWDMVVNTIPLNQLCTQGHTFGAAQIVAAGDAPDLGINVGRLYQCPADHVICNGEEHPSWYRISNIFGHTTVEWPDGIKPPVPTASVVLKPTFNNCDCWPNMLKVGRYGSWRKGVLSHSAYHIVLERIKGVQAGQARTYDDPTVPTLF